MQQGDYSAKSTVLSVVGVNAVWINAKCKATTTNGVYHKKKKERHIYIYIYNAAQQRTCRGDGGR